MPHATVFKFLMFFVSSLLGGLLVGGKAFAQSQQSMESQSPVSLQETLERAYMQNADLDAARAELRVTDETVSQANADWRPSLSVDGIQSQTQTYPIGEGTRSHNSDTHYTATLQQNVFRGGLTVATIEQAESKVLAGKANLFNVEQNTLLTAIQAHTGVIAKETEVNYRKQAEEFYKKNLERTQARFEVGEGSRTDVAASEASYEGEKAELSQALADFESSKATYLRQVGSPPGQNWIQALLYSL